MDGRALAAALAVADEAQARNLALHAHDRTRRLIGAAVVDDQHFLERERILGGRDLVQQRADAVLFVEDRDDDGNLHRICLSAATGADAPRMAQPRPENRGNLCHGTLSLARRHRNARRKQD